MIWIAVTFLVSPSVPSEPPDDPIPRTDCYESVEEFLIEEGLTPKPISNVEGEVVKQRPTVSRKGPTPTPDPISYVETESEPEPINPYCGSWQKIKHPYSTVAIWTWVPDAAPDE